MPSRMINLFNQLTSTSESILIFYHVGSAILCKCDEDGMYLVDYNHLSFHSLMTTAAAAPTADGNSYRYNERYIDIPASSHQNTYKLQEFASIPISEANSVV